jgi:hypothetical protein
MKSAKRNFNEAVRDRRVHSLLGALEELFSSVGT